MSCNWFPTKVNYFHQCSLTRFWLFTVNRSVCTGTEHQGSRHPAARNCASPPEIFTHQLSTPGSVTILQGVLDLTWPKYMKLILEQQCMLSALHKQYHACWCTGDFRSQGIRGHGIGPQSRNIPSLASKELINTATWLLCGPNDCFNATDKYRLGRFYEIKWFTKPA